MSGRARLLRIADRGLRIGRAGPPRIPNPRSAIRTGISLLLLAACAPAPPSRLDPAPATAGVRPGDVIRVSVPNEPGYTGEYQVDSRGRVTLPSVGVVYVAGRKPDAVSDSLVAALRHFLTNPAIEVTVLKRVLVAGEVAKPGLYPVDATVTVGDLIAMAGGPTPNANRKKIQLIRTGRVIVSSLGPGTILQNTPLQSGDQIFIPTRSWLSRNGQFFLVGVVSVTSAVVTAIVLRR